MIIILTGQPNSGKTTLALTLETLLIKILGFVLHLKYFKNPLFVARQFK